MVAIDRRLLYLGRIRLVRTLRTEFETGNSITFELVCALARAQVSSRSSSPSWVGIAGSCMFRMRIAQTGGPICARWIRGHVAFKIREGVLLIFDMQAAPWQYRLIQQGSAGYISRWIGQIFSVLAISERLPNEFDSRAQTTVTMTRKLQHQ